MQHTWLKRPTLTQGFTLLEVLVAVLVLSVGLLGLAVLQMKTLQSAHSGYQRTLASTIASDAAERLWIEHGRNPTSPDIDRAQADWINAWSENNTPGLPKFNQSSRIISTSGDGEYELVIEWDEQRFEMDDQAASRFGYFINIPMYAD